MNEVASQEKEPQPATRIIVMLGSRMKKTGSKDNPGFAFPLISEKPEGKFGDLPVEVSGGDSRMRAVQAMYQEYTKKQNPGQKLLIFTTGGKEKSGESRADEAAKKLTKKYHIPEDIIQSLGSAVSTLGNANTLAEYIEKNK